jgi:hypothetical protein
LLAGAIEDFTGSIKIFPNYGDTWKRRGQARIANGDREGAAKVSSNLSKHTSLILQSA